VVFIVEENSITSEVEEVRLWRRQL